MYHTIPKEYFFLDYLKQVLVSDVFEAFVLHSIFDDSICLGEKQGMVVNNDCGSWYNRIGNFDMGMMVRDWLIKFFRVNPLLSARPMAIHVTGVMVECE